MHDGTSQQIVSFSLYIFTDDKWNSSDFTTQKHLNYHKPELKDSKNRSSRTILHISNSIYGRYTLFNWLLVLAWTLYF